MSAAAFGRRAARARVRIPFIVLVVLVSLLAAGGGTSLWSHQPDEWARLVDIGDALAAGGGSMAIDRGHLTARSAYLLAFHHAQDAFHAPRILFVADRLERLGEPGLAAHVRHVASVVAASNPGRD